MKRTESLRHGFSDMSAVAAAASKTPQEEILERDFLNKKENKYPQLVKYKYKQKQGKWMIIPSDIKNKLEKIRDRLEEKGKIQYVGINELLDLRNLDEINDVFEATLVGLNEKETKKEYNVLVKIWNELNTEIKKVEVSNMRKHALRNSRKKKKKKGGRRTRGKKRKGGNKRQIQINANQIKKNSQNMKKLKLRMERCACKEEEEEDVYDKLSIDNFKEMPKQIPNGSERPMSPTSIMDGPTGAAALALRMGGGYLQKRRRQQKGGERTRGNWIKYNEILPTDRCIRCNEQLMNPQSPEKTAYMMMCGCVVHTECLRKICNKEDEDGDPGEDAADPDDLPPCPGIIGEDDAGPIKCGVKIWESCTDVDEYLKAINGEESTMDSSDDILANPHNYWRIVASATPTAAAPIAGGARFLPRSRRRRRNVTLRRTKRKQGGKKNKRKTKKMKRKRKTKKKHYKKRKWSLKYKRTINCRRPKGFSQRQYCKYKKI